MSLYLLVCIRFSLYGNLSLDKNWKTNTCKRTEFKSYIEACFYLYKLWVAKRISMGSFELAKWGQDVQGAHREMEMIGTRDK